MCVCVECVCVCVCVCVCMFGGGGYWCVWCGNGRVLFFDIKTIGGECFAFVYPEGFSFEDGGAVFVSNRFDSNDSEG